MKFRKSILFTLLLILTLTFTCFCGCSLLDGQDKLTVVSVVKTQTNGLVDTYTITYSDGSKFTFDITNGKDGADMDIQAIYQAYLEIYPNATYEEFLRDILGSGESSNVLAINKALLSSAKIYTEFTQLITPWPITAYDTSISIGSAVVYKIDSDYTYFITNYHVVYNNSAIEENKLPKKIVCYLYGSENAPQQTSAKDENGYTIYNYGAYAIECEYVGGSIKADIAVVKAPTSRVKEINENVKEITFADSYCVGETAIAIGNPRGEGISVAEGIVSVDNEYISLSMDGTSRSYRSIRIDTAIYNGSSGGGLFNKDGKLIGITNAGDGEDQNINYAIPLSIVKNTVENIMYYKDNAKIITLGVVVVSSNSKYVFDEQKGYGEIVETITVNEISAGSISEQLGLAVGDVLTHIVVNGTEYKINRMFNIGDMLYTVRSGDAISFKLTRNGQTISSNIYTVLDSNLNPTV